MAKSNILGIVVEDQKKNDSVKGQALVLFSVKGVLLAVQLYNTNSTENASVRKWKCHVTRSVPGARTGTSCIVRPK